MFLENRPLHDRWVEMVKHGENSKLATENHEASELHKKLFAEHGRDEEVQRAPVMLSHLEPNYTVSPPTTRPGLVVLCSKLGYVQGCSPLRVGKTNPSRVDDLS